MNYFEFREMQTQRSVAFKHDDVIEWPDVVVTESPIDEDQMLELSLARSADDAATAMAMQ